MNRTKIEWVVNPDRSKGFTSNPVRGKCPHYGKSICGIKECYAEGIRRHYGWGEDLTFHPEEPEAIERRNKPATIFVGSMIDIFADSVSSEWRSKIINTAQKCQHHRFVFLTKNPKRYYPFPNLPNCLIGATITGGRDDYGKIDYLLDATESINPQYGTFVSVEPFLSGFDYFPFEEVDWLIVGTLTINGVSVTPEKGGARLEWVQYLLEQAEIYKKPVFLKNNLLTLYPELPKRQDIPYLKGGL